MVEKQRRLVHRRQLERQHRAGLRDNVYIYNGGTAIVSQSGEYGSNLYLGNSGTGASGAIQINSGSLVTTAAYIGHNGTGTVAQSAGALTSASGGGFYLGYNSTGTGAYTLSGTGQLTIGSLFASDTNSGYVGYSGLGTLNQQGGTNTVNRGSLYVGTNSGSIGTYNQSAGAAGISAEGAAVSGDHGLLLGYNSGATGSYNLSGTGQLSVTDGSQYVGYSGAGTFTHSAGTNSVVRGNLYLGYNQGSGGTYTLSGTGKLANATTTGNLYVGYSGTGVFNHSAGTNNTSNATLYLGYNSAGTGTYNLSGTGLLKIGESLKDNGTAKEFVGYSGTGVFDHSGGTNTVMGSLTVGYNSGSNGTYSLRGTGLLNSYDQFIGSAGTGTFTQTAGTNSISDASTNGGPSASLYLGSTAGSLGTYNLSGTGQLKTEQRSSNATSGGQYVGYSGTGVFNHSGGANTVGSSLYVGHNTTAAGTYSMSGTSKLTVGGSEYVGNAGTGVFSQSAGTNTAAGNLYLGGVSGGSGTYKLSGTGQLSAANEYIGFDATAYALFQQTGGTNTTSYLSVGRKGQYTLSGGTLQLNGSLDNNGVFDFGNGTGTLNVTSGIVNFSGDRAPLNTTGATLNISANSLLIVSSGYTPSSKFASYSNAGILHQAGTTLTVASGKTISAGGVGTIDDHVICMGTVTAASGGSIHLTKGLAISGNGLVNLGGGSLQVNNTISGMTGGSLSAISQTVNGTFTHTGGTSSLDSNLCVYSAGTYTLAGTGKVTSNNQYIDGSGVLAQMGGVNSSYGLTIGNSWYGTYGLLGGQLDVTEAHIGVSGVGVFYQSGGTHTVQGTGTVGLSLGENTLSYGSYYLSGTGKLIASQEIVGDAGGGTVTQSGGTNTVSDKLALGRTSGTGEYDLLGGQLNAADVYVAGYTGSTGIFTQTGGTANITGALHFGNGGGTATYVLNGGTLRLHSIVRSSVNAEFQFGGGTLLADGNLSVKWSDDSTTTPALSITLTGTNGNANIDTSDFVVTLADVLAGSGGLNKRGKGTLALSGSNTYEGGTTVIAGTLKVNNTTGSGTGKGAVTVNSGATLAGSGAISGAVTVAGTLAPGDGVGIITIGNNLTFQSGSSLTVEVGGLKAGTSYDQVTVSGAVTLAGSLDVSFGTFTATGHDVLFLINNTGANATTGLFQYADNAKIGRFNGVDWYITYDANNAAVASLNGGNDVALYTVPEPASYLLFSIAAAVLLTQRWWRRRQARSIAY